MIISSCKPDIFEKTYLHEDEMGNISDGYHTLLSLTYIFSTSSSQKKILILCSVSLNMIVVLFQRYKFLISGQRQYMEKPKRTGGGGRTGEAR